MRIKSGIIYILACLTLTLVTGCKSIDDERIPRMPVSIDLSNQGVWATYGVDNFGESRKFILPERIPEGFPYIFNSATGYGGVLLICGQNAFTGAVGPLAYDLACPVERQPSVRVFVNDDYNAQCPVCGSIYNVVEAGGTPVYGQARELGYALTPYQCYATIYGGYFVSN